MKSEQRYFKTTKFALATFLYAKNQVVVGINQVGPGVKEFVFIQSPELQALIEDYQFCSLNDDKLLVSVKVYERARSELMDKLRS